MSIKNADAPEPKMLVYALAYAKKGVPVFPLVPGQKEPLISKADGGNGYHDATTDAEQIKAWWAAEPRANIGIPMARAGLFAIDIDPRNGGSYDQLTAKHGDLPPTLTSQTGGGGLHLVYRHPDCQLEAKVPGVPGIDVKVNGYIVAPPSLHPSGNRYEWIGDVRVPVELPEHYVEALRKRKPERPQGRPITKQRVGANDAGDFWLRRALARSQESSRNDTGFWLACLLRDAGVSESEAHVLMCAYARFAPEGRHVYEEREALASMAQAYRAPAREPARALPAPLMVRPRVHLVTVNGKRAGDEAANELEEGGTPERTPERAYRLTEQGNADRLLDAYGENIRYCSAFGFLIWDTQRWKVDPEGLTVYRWAQAVVNDMFAEASDLTQQAAQVGDPESEEAKQLASAAEAILKWTRQSARHTMYAHMREMIKPRCEVDSDIFDADPWLLNFPNGTLDLKTGVLRNPQRTDYLTRISTVAYDANALAPRFDKFLDEIMLERGDLIDYLQRALGYTLTGSVREQVWHLLIGDGDNGKGVLMEAVGEILGDLTAEVEPEYITLGGRPVDPNSPSPVAANLKGKRFVKITETAEGARIDAAKVKKLTGADTLTGRNLHKGVMRFRPTHKLWIYTNHKPETRETKHAFWRRVRYIPFEFNAEKAGTKDQDLPEKLRAEYPGILAWLVRGCLAWQREGLRPPQAVLEATQQYKRDMQPLRDFLDERCILESEAWMPFAMLWAIYEGWAKDFHARRVLTKTEFTTALKEAGCKDATRKHLAKNARGWLGIRLRTDSEPEPDPEHDPEPDSDSELDTSVHTFTPGNATFGIFPLSETPREENPESSVNECERVNDSSLADQMAACKKAGHAERVRYGNEIHCSFCDEVLEGDEAS